jgi:hypothetical protein
MFCDRICRGCRGLIGTIGPATGIATSALRALYSLPVSVGRRRRTRRWKRRRRPPFRMKSIGFNDTIVAPGDDPGKASLSLSRSLSLF